jgi:hypothetical protein
MAFPSFTQEIECDLNGLSESTNCRETQPSGNRVAVKARTTQTEDPLIGLVQMRNNFVIPSKQHHSYHQIQQLEYDIVAPADKSFSQSRLESFK